jgi:transposase, IS5 family
MLKRESDQGELFEIELNRLVEKSDPLVRLSESIQWERFEEELGKEYTLDNGRPGVPIRVLVGAIVLKYLHGGSDEEIVTGIRRTDLLQCLHSLR